MSNHQNPPNTPNTTELANRVTTYLNRHIAWLKENLSDLQKFQPDLPTQDLDTLLQHQQQREEQLKHLHREHHALLREWQQAQNIDTPHITAVQELAAQAESLTENLRKRFEETIDILQQGADTNTESLRATRQGRDLLKKYRPGGDQLSSFIDKKA